MRTATNTNGHAPRAKGKPELLETPEFKELMRLGKEATRRLREREEKERIEESVKKYLIEEIAERLADFDLASIRELCDIVSCAHSCGGNMSALAEDFLFSLERMGLVPEATRKGMARYQ